MRNSRISPRTAVLGGLLVAAVLALAAAYMVWSARQDLNAGLADLRLAQNETQARAAQSAPAVAFESARRDVARAYGNFQTADARLAPLAPVLEHLSGLPGIGQQAAAAPPAARLSDQLAAGTLSLLDGLQPIVNGLHGARGHTAIRTQQLVAQLAAGHDKFVRACAELDQAGATRARLRGYHDARLTSALQTVDRRLPQLRVLCRALALMPDFMGYGQPRTYLVAYQNNSELRASGGFIGSAGLLTLHAGQITQQFSGTGIRDNLSVPPPEPFLLYNRESAWLFRDSNWSPDFPTTAALERFFYRLDFHSDPFGVVDVTPQAASDILAATGPIYSPEYHRWITSSNVAQLADYYSHWTTAYGPEKFSNLDTQRKQFIGIMGRRVVARLGALSASRLYRLGNNIATAVARRDIQLQFHDRAAETLLRDAGASGEINQTRGDFLYVVGSNLAYNKINPWIHESVEYAVSVRSDRWLRARLTLHIRNTGAPAAMAASSYGPGGGRLGKPLDYADFVRVYAPNGAQLNHDAGWTESWLPGPAYGKEMFCGYIIVPVGQERTIHLEYVVPPNVFSPTHGREYTLVVQHQPGSHLDALTVSVTHDGRPATTWIERNPVADWTRSVPVTPRAFSPLPLPRNPARPVVAPWHWIEPHTYLRGLRP